MVDILDDPDLIETVATMKKGRRRAVKVIEGGKDDGPPRTWGLVLDKEGRPEPCLYNAVELLRQAHDWGPRFSYDDFSGKPIVDGKRLEESDELEITKWFQRNWNWKFNTGTVVMATRSLGFERRHDALTDHVNACKWDLVPRVDHFWRYVTSEDTPHHRAAGRILLLSMAARALYPGCKMDTMIILEGRQGIKKSTAIQILGGPFFSELLATAGTKEAAEQVEGSWVMEVGELDAMNRAELSAAKQFMSRLSDRFRRAYARSVTDVLRRCVMVGTTNKGTYLRDETGGRRWLPIRCTEILDMELRRDRDQLIAEAVYRVRAGEPWWLVDTAEVEAAKEAVLERFEEDPWQSKMAFMMAKRDILTVSECMDALGMDVQHRGQAAANRISAVLVAAGWEKGQRCVVGDSSKKERCYRKSSGK